MFKSLLKNTPWLFLAEIVNKGTFFIATIIIARVFGVDVFGQFNLAFSFVVIFSIFADFGINNAIIREIARNKKIMPKLIGNGMAVKLFLSILTFLIIWLTTVFFLKKGERVDLIIYLLSFYVIFNSYNTFLKSIYRAYEKMKYEAFLKIIESFLLIGYLCFSCFYLRSIFFTVLGFSFASLATLVISLFWIYKYLGRFRFFIDWKIIRFIFKESWPFALAGVFVTIYFNIDTVMISLIKGDIETGLYSVSYNFIFGISLIASLASASVYPYLSRVYKIKTEIKNVNKYIKMFFLLGCSMGLILFFLSRKLIELFYGIEYSESTLSLRILSLSLPFSFACTFLGTFIASINKQIVGTLITGLVAFLNIILNFILIEKFGHAGAAVASLISFFLMFLMLLIAYLFYSSNKSKK